jgi:hypothetical protein
MKKRSLILFKIVLVVLFFLPHPFPRNLTVWKAVFIVFSSVSAQDFLLDHYSGLHYHMPNDIEYAVFLIIQLA